MSRRPGAALLLVCFGAAASALALSRSAQPAYPVSDITLAELCTRHGARGSLLVGSGGAVRPGDRRRSG